MSIHHRTFTINTGKVFLDISLPIGVINLWKDSTGGKYFKSNALASTIKEIKRYVEDNVPFRFMRESDPNEWVLRYVLEEIRRRYSPEYISKRKAVHVMSDNMKKMHSSKTTQPPGLFLINKEILQPVWWEVCQLFGSFAKANTGVIGIAKNTKEPIVLYDFVLERQQPPNPNYVVLTVAYKGITVHCKYNTTYLKENTMISAIKTAINLRLLK